MENNKKFITRKRNITSRDVYRSYLASAERRGLDFKLTFEFFENNNGKNCFYCGEKPKKLGLDRVNNSIGYTEDNVVVCCKMCNIIKGQKSVKEFYEYVEKTFEEIKRTLGK